MSQHFGNNWLAVLALKVSDLYLLFILFMQYSTVYSSCSTVQYTVHQWREQKSHCNQLFWIQHWSVTSMANVLQCRPPYPPPPLPPPPLFFSPLKKKNFIIVFYLWKSAWNNTMGKCVTRPKKELPLLWKNKVPRVQSSSVRFSSKW